MHECRNNQVKQPHGRSYHLSQYHDISLTDCFVRLDEPYFIDDSNYIGRAPTVGLSSLCQQ